MKIHELSPCEGSRKRKKRVGRGVGSGHGGTSCRGHKGQLSRSGGRTRPGFEGGQMPLQRRLPKRGFKNPFRKVYNIINVADLDRFESDVPIDSDALQTSGLTKKRADGVKLLGNGEISKPLVVRVHKISQTARDKIEAAGGRVEIV
ncbi:MAG: 50S ribosomal protein L15 [Desulfobacteraceae bacterium]